MNVLRDADVLPGRIVSMLRLLPLHRVPLLSLWTNLVDFALCGCGTLRGMEDSGTESCFCSHSVWVIVRHRQESWRIVNIC